MQEVCNCSAICIRRGKSVLGKSCVKPRECAEHTFVLLGFLFLEYKTIDIFPEKYYYTDTTIKQMLNYLMQAFTLHTINMEKNNKFIVCNTGKEIYHEENV